MSCLVACESLDTAFSFVEAEIAQLKKLEQIRGLSLGEDSALMQEYRKLESIISGLENKLTSIDSYLEKEKESIAEFNAICVKVEQQKNEIKGFVEVPEPIPEPIPSAQPGAFTPISEDSFQQISATTRGRLTLSILNGAWSELFKMFEKKTLSNSIKLNGSLRTSILSLYLTESEIRNSIVFKSGESTGKAILASLRSLHLLRVTRQQKEQCYYICGENEKDVKK